MDREALIDAAMGAYLDFFGYSELEKEREAFTHVLAAIAPAIRADERAACIALVYGHAGSDNDAQRIVDAIRQRGTAKP